MGIRLEAVEVIALDKTFSPAQCQAFIEQWNKDNPEKYNNEAFMPLFSPFISSCELIKSEDVTKKKDLLKVVMEITVDNWPKQQEVADITFFVVSLRENYDHLDVKMLFDVSWED